MEILVDLQTANTRILSVEFRSGTDMSAVHVLLSSSQHTCDATSALGHGSTAVEPPLASGAPAPARVSQMGREPASLSSQQAGSVHFR